VSVIREVVVDQKFLHLLKTSSEIGASVRLLSVIVQRWNAAKVVSVVNCAEKTTVGGYEKVGKFRKFG